MVKNKSKISKYLNYVIFFFLIILCNHNVLFSYCDTVLQDAKEKRIKEWNAVKKQFPVSDKAIKLTPKLSFPNEAIDTDDVYLAQPQSLCLDDLANIYISDFRENCVLKFDLEGSFIKKISSKGQGPTEILSPFDIAFDFISNIVVYDTGNNRIQFFNKKGDHVKGIKLKKSISSFSMNKQGQIFYCPSSAKPDEPLIEVINQEGEILNTFGNRIKFKYDTPTHNSVILSSNEKGELYVAWRNFPFVHKYSKDGKLLSEFIINYDLIDRKTKFNYQSKMSDGRISFKIAFAGMRAKNSGFYLFLYYPRIEVLEFDLNGKLVNIFWTEQPYNYIGTDFFVFETEKEKLFYFLQGFPEPKIEVFSAQNELK